MKIQNYWYFVIDAKNAILPPFNSSQWGDSNKLCYIFLQSLDAEEFNEMHFSILISNFCWYRILTLVYRILAEGWRKFLLLLINICIFIIKFL